VAYARVLGEHPEDLLIASGSPLVRVSAAADAQGRFVLSSTNPISLITATSADLKRSGRSSVESPSQPVIVTIR
jgi:hypothetical protein